MRDELVAKLGEPVIDRAAVNACMRALFQQAIVNVAGNMLQLVWKRGQATVLLLTRGEEIFHRRRNRRQKHVEEPWGPNDIEPYTRG
jgi:hypothetical protein